MEDSAEKIRETTHYVIATEKSMIPEKMCEIEIGNFKLIFLMCNHKLKGHTLLSASLVGWPLKSSRVTKLC